MANKFTPTAQHQIVGNTQAPRYVEQTLPGFSASSAQTPSKNVKTPQRATASNRTASVASFIGSMLLGS